MTDSNDDSSMSSAWYIVGVLLIVVIALSITMYNNITCPATNCPACNNASTITCAAGNFCPACGTTTPTQCVYDTNTCATVVNSAVSAAVASATANLIDPSKCPASTPCVYNATTCATPIANATSGLITRAQCPACNNASTTTCVAGNFCPSTTCPTITCPIGVPTTAISGFTRQSSMAFPATASVKKSYSTTDGSLLRGFWTTAANECRNSATCKGMVYTMNGAREYDVAAVAGAPASGSVVWSKP